LVYDGQTATNDLEEIWDMFNTRLPAGFDGHTLAMSDVVELYDHTGSAFYYVDRFGFAQIGFKARSQNQGFNMEMGV
jgi:hypothetical protein